MNDIIDSQIESLTQQIVDKHPHLKMDICSEKFSNICYAYVRNNQIRISLKDDHVDVDLCDMPKDFQFQFLKYIYVQMNKQVSVVEYYTINY